MYHTYSTDALYFWVVNIVHVSAYYYCICLSSIYKNIRFEHPGTSD